MFLHQKTKETGIHNPKKGVGHWQKKEVVKVHDEVKLPKGEVRPANWILIIKYWWLSQLTLDYASLITAEQGIRHDENSANFRITVTKKFYEKLKRVGGVDIGH